jgi:hypothetical protein
MLDIQKELGGLDLNATLSHFKPNLGATYVTLVNKPISIKPLGYLR